MDRLNDALPAAALVPFSVQRIRRTATLWSDGAALARRDPALASAAEFAARFSYGVRTNPSFAGLDWDDGDARTAAAERYGGFGIGRHGGGARAGNLDGFQIKGVGRNPVAGVSDSTINAEFHGFGGFNLVDAVCDVVNSEMFGRVLPHGTVKCFGLILSGAQTAYYPQRVDADRSFGVLLVRDLCVRPAHFVRAPHFATTAAQMLAVGGDVSRVRAVCRALQERHGTGRDGFPALVKRFLTASAKQFAFARLWRIAHGSVTPSNLAMDGAWLDMMGASFLEPGMNYAPSPDIVPFLGEAEIVKPIAGEVVDTFAKYTGTDLQPESFAAFYDRQFEAALRFYLPRFFGLGIAAVGDFARTSAAAVLVQAVMRALTVGLRLTDLLPDRADVDDPAATLVERLVRGEIERRGDPLATAFRALVDAAFARRATREQSRHAFIGGIAMRSLKRLSFASSLFRARLVAHASALVLDGDMTAVGPAIDEWRDRATWVLSLEPDGERTIARGARCALRREPDGAVTLDRGGTVTRYDGRDSLRQLGAAVQAMPGEDLALPPLYGFPPVRRYDFRPGVVRILRLLEALETP